MYPGWQEDAFWERCREQEERPFFGEGRIDFSRDEEKAAADDYGCVIPAHAFWDDGIVYQYGLFD